MGVHNGEGKRRVASRFPSINSTPSNHLNLPPFYALHVEKLDGIFSECHSGVFVSPLTLIPILDGVFRSKQKKKNTKKQNLGYEYRLRNFRSCADMGGT